MKQITFTLLCLTIGSAASAQVAGKPLVPTKSAAKITVRTPKISAPKPVAIQITVMVKVNPEVAGQSFTLGEIAEITGNDKATIKQLSQLLIGTSPLPGMTRMLRPGDITVRLRGARLELPNIEVVAPPEMSIARAKSDVATDEIVKAALPVAQDRIKEMADTSIEPIPPTNGVTLPKGNVTFAVGAVRGEPTLGKIMVPVALKIDGKIQQTVEVAFKVTRRTRVLIATRTLEPNEILTLEDIAFAKIDLPSGFVRPVQTLKDAVGRRVKSRVNADAPISLNLLDLPPAVKYNDRVTIEFIIGSVRITAPGLVRGMGAIGDTIRVHAPDTKKDLDAVVVDSRTVRIAELEPQAETTEETIEAPESDPKP
ncbi:flagellar basal body P-ring formation chaperone FlgA [Nostoc sp. CHAB 5824]|nr:flagellar basal body P-ring formation chaperone FlgA [Nostoc sp. CHAB 5824]